MTSDECEACSGPVGLLGSPCMACVKARHRAAVTGTLRVRSQGATADGIEWGPALVGMRPVSRIHQAAELA